MHVRYQYQTVEFGTLDIHVRTLRDTNEFDDPKGKGEALGIGPAMWPLFGVVWPSSIVLAAMMLNWDIEGLRILEVGCGIAVPSLVLQGRGADITASDRHPEVQGFLDYNAALNGLAKLPFARADWLDDQTEIGRFDLIIASDILHDHGLAGPLARFVAEHSKPRSTMIIIDPGRGRVGGFVRTMEGLGFTYDKRRAVDDETLLLPEEVSPRIQIHEFRRG